jgi:exopolysaccharide biosynthesis predicted pyruvyltransferase EpsI
MNFRENNTRLTEEIYNQLGFLKQYKKCLLLGLPYHHQVGDHLIWLGIEFFLKSLSINIWNFSSRVRLINIRKSQMIPPFFSNAGVILVMCGVIIKFLEIR